MGSSNEKERERERDKDIKLTDLFDVDMLQRMQDAFSNMTGLAAVITDAYGVALTKSKRIRFASFVLRNRRAAAPLIAVEIS